jgi:methyl-accepting chemotaxis protein
MISRMKDERGSFVGNVAIGLSADQLNAIVQQRSGMGETGESDRLGKLNGKSSLRSDRVVKTGKIVDAKSDAYIELALNGQAGSAVKTGSTGDKEFVRCDPATVSGLNWALITTATADEVFGAAPFPAHHHAGGDCGCYWTGQTDRRGNPGNQNPY